MEALLTDIPEKEVLRYLGHERQIIDADLKAQIERCINSVKSSSRPRLTYTVRDVKDGIINGLDLGGNDIKILLSSCKQAIIMAATLGPEAEQMLRRAEVLNMSDAVILDSAQSTAIENVCDNFEAMMRQKYKDEGLYLTDRYSPGYGDLPMESQKKILDILFTEKRIGLTLTPSNIMVPRKSVTCIIGISEQKQRLVLRGCANCTLNQNCSYRKGGLCHD